MKLSIRKSIDEIKTFSRVFVERPRFAMVIAIVLSMAGGMAIFKLPVSQYPRITPPSIQVNYTYPGANAKEVLNTVAMPIEDEVNGVDDMLYMTGSCGDDGTYSLAVTFEVETDRDMDMVKVQNRVAQAEAKLPGEVKQLGGRIRAQSEDMLGFIAVLSPNGSMSRLQISDYIYSNIQPVLLRVPGVGDAPVYGPKLSMRVWLDPARMAAQGMNTEEVIAAVSKQNIQASLGAVGAAPKGDHAAHTLSLLAKGRLMSPKEFDEIVVRRDANGGVVRLKDIARTEIGEQNYMFTGQLDGRNAVSIALQQKPGANAIATMKAIRKEMAKLKESFPDDLEWVIPYDATEYVSGCVKEILITLAITFALVVIVCYLFLQDWRATLIPCLTIPVSLSSTFILMAALGYSINILTLFGLVLAIGVVVDDCIVVVERVQFLIETRGLNSKEATIQAMSDVTSAVIATTLVLLGIFVPVGFMSGITGRIYQQFSITLSAAVCFSTLCALTLAPALCSLLLHESRPYRHGPLAWFNWLLNAFKGFFVRLAKWLARRILLAFALLVLVVLLVFQAFRSTQTSFLPDEDQRVIFISMDMPEGSTRDRTRDVSLRAVETLLKMDEVKSVLTITGLSMMGGRGENQSMVIVDLKDWSERRLPNQSAAAMVQRLQEKLADIPEPNWKVFMPPAIPGLGMANGITVNVQDKGGADPLRMDEVKNKVLAVLNDKKKFPDVMAAFSGYNAVTPHLRFNLDRTKAEMFKVPVATVYATLQNYLGSRYVNDVNLGTQVNRVTVQADWEGRATPEAVARLYVRGENGAMVQIGSLGDITRELGPRTVYTRDKYVTCSITVMPMPGAATGRIMADMRKMFKEVLPQDYGYEWAALSFQEARNEGGAAPLILLAVLFGYLFLVAQYESWTVPMPVMLSIFVAVLGALCGLKWFGIFMTGSPYPLSIYAQLGLVLLVGLASKNAILIVEFAKDKRENEHYSIADAAGAAAGERLRALLMTALTTLLGTLPMMIATGAGAASRNHLGTTEFWGMLFSVAFGILLVPGLYALFQTWRERIKRFFEYISVKAYRARRDKAAAATATFSLALCAVLAGCSLLPSVGPDYEELDIEIPELPLPDAGSPTTNTLAGGEFKTAEADEDVRTAITAESIREWWAKFEDPVLDGLVGRATTNNISFLMAQHRLMEARWSLLGAYAAFMPQVGASASAVRMEKGKNTSSMWSSGKKLHQDVFSAGFDASWEIDIFGGVRRATEAAWAEAEAAGWSFADAWVSLTAEVASDYVALRTVQSRIAVARKNLALQKETYEILKSRLDSGIGDELAVNQSKYVMDQTHAAIPPLLAEETSLKDALAILAGEMPGALDDLLAPVDGRDWLVPPEKLDGTPMDAIRSRPDVRTAERKLAARVAHVGVAKSMWYPKLYINGTLGLESVHPSKLLRRDSLFGSIGPSISWPIFRGGSIYANIKVEEERMQEAVLAYELSIQKAAAEVRDAYSAYTQEYHRYMALQGAVKAAEDAVAISNDLYKNGLKDFTAVIDAQRSLLSLEESLVVSRGQITGRLIALYKALGGGIHRDPAEKM